MDFKNKYSNYVYIVNQHLEKLFMDNSDCPEKSVIDSMRYSILAGGKRIRPVLALAVCEMLNGDIDDILPFALAIEMMHTYSLIHDDLPAMDNDDYRRGTLTNHKVFGEATAILAGDGLLNYAFEFMSESIVKRNDNLLNKIIAMNAIAKASGYMGMIGGQIIDLESENKIISADLLNEMHKRKTGALIKAPIISAAIVCKTDDHQFKLLDKYAENIGLAFQIKDDILDVEGDDKVLGKPIGSDSVNKKSTFISIYGIEKSKQMLENLICKAIKDIQEFGEKSVFLQELAKYILERKN